MSRHAATMEAGGWTLLLASIAVLAYLLLHPKGKASISSTVAPTAGVPKITSEIADAIGRGQISAKQWSPGTTCDPDTVLMDAGQGTLWCVCTPSGGFPA